MTTPELKPCPFCGGTEIHFGPMDAPSAWECWVVGCNNYDCPLDVDSVKVEFGTPEKAAAAWNTRATDANLAALQAENERLRAEVSGLRAARIAYANEFPATEDGDPDTGNIHANIRALKARAEQLAAEVERLRRLVQERDTMLGKRLCSGTNADGKPRCIVLAEERARAERLAEALEEVRSRSSIDLAMRSDQFELTARLGDIYQIAYAALAQEDRNG